KRREICFSRGADEILRVENLLPRVENIFPRVAATKNRRRFLRISGVCVTFVCRTERNAT
ncbi:MAG: hypothetical protein II681_00500, partial [Bacteroidaceae bacterium]|nr:hypothetical protein [Bacteroidaceae bacterium]